MRLRLDIIVPRDAPPAMCHALLAKAAHLRTGITLRTAEEDTFDVDLIGVEEVRSGKDEVVRHLEY